MHRISHHVPLSFIFIPLDVHSLKPRFPCPAALDRVLRPKHINDRHNRRTNKQHPAHRTERHSSSRAHTDAAPAEPQMRHENCFGKESGQPPEHSHSFECQDAVLVRSRGEEARRYGEVGER